MAKTEAAAAPAVGVTRHVANETDWFALCMEPDYCKVGNCVVAFETYAMLSNKLTASPNVKTQCQAKPVYRIEDMVGGVLANMGAGIGSKTSLGSGNVKFTENGQDNVKVNGKPTVRDGTICMINCDGAGMGGARGAVYTLTKVPRAILASQHKMLSQMSNETLLVLGESWTGLKGTVTTLWEAFPGTSDDATTGLARDKAWKAISSGVEGIGALMGVPYELREEAYRVGDPDLLAMVEEGDRRQMDAFGAIATGIVASVKEANERNGIPGVIARGATKVVVDAVTDKGMGAVAKAGARIAGVLKAAKTPLEAVIMLDKEIAKAKVAGESAAAIDLMKKKRDAKLEDHAKEMKQAEKAANGVHVDAKPAKQQYSESKIKKDHYDPKDLGFDPNQEKHLRGPDGFNQSDGVKGSHNMTVFDDISAEKKLKIISKEPGSVPGIYEIKYKIPAHDSAGNAIFDKNGVQVYQDGAFIKTVYDPAIFSDERIFQLGKEAAANGYADALAKKLTSYPAYAGGIEFQVYRGTGPDQIRNFHPK